MLFLMRLAAPFATLFGSLSGEGYMSRSARHLINALICLAVGGHAVYWFATGGAEFASSLRVGLVVAQAVLGLAGAVWFYSRSRSTLS